jgi:hypothetical protein
VRRNARLGLPGRRWRVSCIPCTLWHANYLWLRRPAHCGEFEQIVDGADERPFALHRGQAAPQELAKAARLLDLPEHRFDHLLAQPVWPLTTSSAELFRHRRHPALRRGGSRFRRWCAVLLAASGDVSVDFMAFERRQIVLGAIAGIGRDLLRSSREIGGDLLNQSHQMRAITP